MLRRVGVTLCVAALVIGVPTAAQAKRRPPAVVVSGNNDGVVQTVVRDPGASGHKIVQVSASSSSAGHSSCSWQMILMIARLPLPNLDRGTWYAEWCGGPGYAAVVFVPNRANNAPPVRATAATLAQQAVNRLPLPAPSVRHNPSGDALVNVSTWWWVDPRQWRSLTQRTAVGSVWARVSARPVKSVWDAGDGTPPLTCQGGGTPYDTNKPADEQSTNCAHTYTESSAGQPQSGPDPNDRFFTVTVTVYWQVRFVGAGGAGGALPVMTRTARFSLRVVERQTVVTGGSG